MYFITFRIHLNLYELNLIHFLTAPGIAWQAAIKKTKVELELLTEINVINGRKRLQRFNTSCYSLICES